MNLQSGEMAAQSDGTGFGTDSLAVPTEDVLLLRVALPLHTHRQRLAALGFALEDLIAEPLEVSHVALGAALAPGEYLAAVVRHSKVSEWAAQITPHRSRLVPDVLSLPIPTERSASVREANGRILVRRADGTGYATSAVAIEALLHADGSPALVLYGGDLPKNLPIAATGTMPASTPDAISFDLLQGPYVRNFGHWPRTITRLAMVAGLTLAAHGAILGVDTILLQRLATQREMDLRSALTMRLPNIPASIPIDVALQRAMPSDTVTKQSAFLPILSQVTGALQSSDNDMTFSSLSFDSAEGSLVLVIEATDLATLQRAQTDLTAAGLTVSSGPATLGDGTAEVRLIILTDGG